MTRQGGSYIADKNGKTRLVERTQDHPGGNRPRDENGGPLDAAPRARRKGGGKVTPLRTEE